MNSKRFVETFHFWIALTTGLVIAVLVYLLGREFRIRHDVRHFHRESASAGMTQALDAYQGKPVTLTGFFAGNQRERLEMDDLCKTIALDYSHFHCRFVDPDREPDQASRQGIDAYGVIILEANGKRLKVEIPREETLAAALKRAMRPEAERIMFVSGHGEPSLSDKGENGYERFAGRLTDAGFAVVERPLAEEIPQDIRLVILSGPHTDLKTAELDRLLLFLERGGQAVIAMDPVLPGEGGNIENFLVLLGINLGHDVVIDQTSKEFGAEPLVAVLSLFQPHPVFFGFREPVFLPIARSVRRMSAVPDGYLVQELALNSRNSWAETNLSELENDQAVFNPDEDAKGPVPLVAGWEYLSGKGKLLVIGDSDLFNNTNLGLAGNRHFAMRMTEWLAEGVFAVPRKTETPAQPLWLLSSVEQFFVFFVPVIGIPVIFLLAGVVSFLRRRAL